MKKLFLLPIFLLLAASAANADYIYTIEEWSSDSGTMTNQVSVDGKLLKMSMHQGDAKTPANDMIFRGDRKETVIVDHGRKSYMVMDEETIGQLGSQVNDAMAQVNKALEGLPEDQRIMMEKMMKDRMPQAGATKPKSEVRKTSERADKAGYPCVKYEVLVDGKKTQEMWVTDWSKIEGGSEVAALFQDMSKFFEGLIEAFSSMSGALGNMPFVDSPFSSLKEMNGFPVATVSYDKSGEIERRSELKSVRRADLSPADFEPTAGYRKEAMMARP